MGLKKYLLSDGSVVTSREVADTVGIKICAARRRLKATNDPVEVFARKFTNQNLYPKLAPKKKIVSSVPPKAKFTREQMIVDTRSFYDPLWRLALINI
jgi:hypothetical protein